MVRLALRGSLAKRPLRKVAATTWIRASYGGELLDEGAGDVADGDVGFLDALGVAGRNVQEQVDFAG